MTDLRVPSLVQRVKVRKEPRESSKGIDRFFEFDYMGATEFEVGLNPALKAMRADNPKKWKVRSITVGPHTAYFVGREDCMTVATVLFEDQLKPRAERKHYCKEATRIQETYAPNKNDKFAINEPFDGWWVIEAHPLPFALFKAKGHAELFLGAL
jgi:hypothetical protein